MSDSACSLTHTPVSFGSFEDIQNYVKSVLETVFDQIVKINVYIKGKNFGVRATRQEGGEHNQ